MKTCSAVLLDFDGTLLNSRIVDEMATKKLFKEHIGRPLSDEEFAGYVGLNSKKILEIVVPDRADELIDIYFQYENEHRWRAQLYPGIKDMLATLKKADLPLAVVTAQSSRELAVNRKLQKIDPWIDVWVSSDDVQNPKPAPDQVRRALHLLNASPEEAIMIGDTHFDILSGQNAGTTTGVAMWGVHDPQEIQQYEPDYLFHEPEEITALCLQKNA
jgi:pyrophosphatase PpaX